MTLGSSWLEHGWDGRFPFPPIKQNLFLRPKIGERKSNVWNFRFSDMIGFVAQTILVSQNLVEDGHWQGYVTVDRE